MRRTGILILGLVSALPLVHVIVFMIVFFVGLFSPTEHFFDPNWVGTFAAAHVMTMLLCLALAGYYIYDLWNNPRIAPDKRVLWLILILFVGVFAWLVYWYVHKWKAGGATHSDSAGA